MQQMDLDLPFCPCWELASNELVKYKITDKRIRGTLHSITWINTIPE
jgi:hypothetical protein